MTDPDPIGIVIEVHARDLHAALADLVDGVTGAREHARSLLTHIEELAQASVQCSKKE